MMPPRHHQIRQAKLYINTLIPECVWRTNLGLGTLWEAQLLMITIIIPENLAVWENYLSPKAVWKLEFRLSYWSLVLETPLFYVIISLFLMLSFSSKVKGLPYSCIACQKNVNGSQHALCCSICNNGSTVGATRELTMLSTALSWKETLISNGSVAYMFFS